MGNKSSSTASKNAPPPTHNPGDGIRSLESSGLARTKTPDSKRTGFWNVAKSKTINEAAFRTLNFELYMKPNKPIMIFGLATMTFITSYFAYTQATTGTERGSTPKKMIYPREWSPKMTSFLTYSHVFLDTSAKHFFTNMPVSMANGLFYGFTGSFSTKL